MTGLNPALQDLIEHTALVGSGTIVGVGDDAFCHGKIPVGMTDIVAMDFNPLV